MESSFYLSIKGNCRLELGLFYKIDHEWVKEVFNRLERFMAEEGEIGQFVSLMEKLSLDGELIIPSICCTFKEVLNYSAILYKLVLLGI